MMNNDDSNLLRRAKKKNATPMAWTDTILQ